MKSRSMYVVLAVQALFASGLLYLGYQARENRKYNYLELTHRVTAGQAVAADFERLAGFLPEPSEKPVVRALFGLPLRRATQIEVIDGEKTSTRKGEIWLYYPLAKAPTLETPAVPIDFADTEKFKGPFNVS